MFFQRDAYLFEKRQASFFNAIKSHQLPTMSLSERIKQKAFQLGFSACGIAKAEPVENDGFLFDRWIADGCHAGMKYLENHRDIRLNPDGLVPGARSVISVALNYYPPVRQADGHPRIAYYAYGEDYHTVVKDKLRLLWQAITEEILPSAASSELPLRRERKETIPAPETFFSEEEAPSVLVETSSASLETSSALLQRPSAPSEMPLIQTRAASIFSEAPPAARFFTDSAPLLERYWAWKAGLGFIGKNTQLILPGQGSFFFLGEIVTTWAADRYDRPQKNRCGTCTRCLDACPTAALGAHRLDASRCLSYLTIEHKGEISPALAARLGNRLYGCDTCQLVCPWNRFARPTSEKAFVPNPDLLALGKNDFRTLTREEYNRIFARSAVKRAKYEGLLRTLRYLNDDRNCTEEREDKKGERKGDEPDFG